MPKNYFGEHIAKNYDESAAQMFEPAKVDPVVDFLADLNLTKEPGDGGLGTWIAIRTHARARGAHEAIS